jgi:hypothetical protein
VTDEPEVQGPYFNAKGAYDELNERIKKIEGVLERLAEQIGEMKAEVESTHRVASRLDLGSLRRRLNG